MSQGSVLKIGACSLELNFVMPPPARFCAPSLDLPPVPPPTTTLETSCFICLGGGDDPRNPLLTSQCACKKLIHGNCLKGWVKSKHVRDCCICKSPLPIPWLCTVMGEPLLSLRVCRHVRGLRWGGQREYLMSMSRGMESLSIGHGRDVNDIFLPDFSVSKNRE